MAYIDDERYSRVNPEKMLDAADKLETAVKKMESALRRMEVAVGTAESLDVRKGYAKGSWWSGEARDRWSREFDGAHKNLKRDLEKYKEFPRYIRTYAEIYLKAAVNAEQTGEELGENVRELLASVYNAYGMTPGSGTATIKDIRSAFKAKPMSIWGVQYDPPKEEE